MMNWNARLTSNSGRGGLRENAGRKSSWRHSETQTIRVPKVFALALMKLAHKLDSEETIDTDTKSNSEEFDSDTDSNFPLADSVTDSIWSFIDTDTNSKAGEIAQDRESNQTDTKSNPGEFDSDTDSNSPLSDSVTDSMLPLSAALVQTAVILKAKRSARASLAKLLSAIYHTHLRPDDLGLVEGKHEP